MDKKKFDGPSFLNPSHTSFGLDNGKNFQVPAVNSSKDVTKKAEPGKNGTNAKRGAKAWEDDEDTANKNYENTPMPTKIPAQPSSTSTKKVFTSESLPTSAPTKKNIYKEEPTGKCYWDSENTKKIQTSTMSIEHETKIIDDVLKVSGVSIKPTENQLKEFLKRIRTLSKEIVFKIIHQRLYSLEKTDDPNQSKVLIKLLYVVETIIHEKSEGYLEYFQKNMDIFTLILQSHNDNKKINELCTWILSELNNEPQNKGKSIEKKVVKSTSNLITEKPKTEDIISSSESDQNSLNNPETKSKFSFIKKKVNEPEVSQNVENPVKKEPDMFSNLIVKESEKSVVTPAPNSFSFIKNKKIPASTITNPLVNQLEQVLLCEATSQPQQANQNKNEKSVIDLNLLSQCYLNTNGTNTNTNGNLTIYNNNQPQFNNISATQHYSSQLILNPNENQTIKYNPPYLDIPYNPSLMEVSSSAIHEDEDKQPQVKERKKEYFGFVNDMLKKK